MAQMPKRVKHRKVQKGRIKGNATRGNRVVFGDFGLQASEGGWISAATIEAGELPPSSTCVVKEDCTFACFPTSQLLRFLWKRGWEKARESPITGHPW